MAVMAFWYWFRELKLVRSAWSIILWRENSSRGVPLLEVKSIAKFTAISVPCNGKVENEKPSVKLIDSNVKIPEFL